MIREVTFPIETKTENDYRRMHWRSTADVTAKQRTIVAEALANLTPCAMYLGGFKPENGNRFVVTLTRIATVFLDDDNDRGALKAVRDEVAKWIGLDDRHAWIEFKYLQQQCRKGFQGVRIMIACNESGTNEKHIVPPAPQLLGEAVARPVRELVVPPPHKVGTAPAAATPPPILPVYALPSWNKTPIRLKSSGTTPAKTLNVKRQGSEYRETLVLECVNDSTLGNCWMYKPVS